MHKILSCSFKSEKVAIKKSLSGHTIIFLGKKKCTVPPIGEREAFTAKGEADWEFWGCKSFF